MYIPTKTLDDLLRQVLGRLIRNRNQVTASKGSMTELTGVLLKLANPRARLSRTEIKGTLFSCLGELCWYLSRSNDLSFISYYLSSYHNFSDDGETLHGAYGPRLFCMRKNDQIANVIALLARKRTSRQAVIQLFDSSDIVGEFKDVPCTCTLQFIVRRDRLHMFTNMRSNDAFVGLPHDVFCFTMIQEIMARSLGVELGTYKHAVGSLHLYDTDREKAQQYLAEGWQSTMLPMPPMPRGDPRRSISLLLDAESGIRAGHKIDIFSLDLDAYWADLVRILYIFSISGDAKTIELVKNAMSHDAYKIYVEKRKTMKPPTRRVPTQFTLSWD